MASFVIKIREHQEYWYQSVPQIWDYQFHSSGHGDDYRKCFMKNGGGKPFPQAPVSEVFFLDPKTNDSEIPFKVYVTSKQVNIQNSDFSYYGTMSRIWTVTLNASSGGNGSVRDSSNSDFGGSRTYGVWEGESISVRLVASPANGYVFDRWSDGNTNAARNVTLTTGDVSLVAYFKKRPKNLTIQKSQNCTLKYNGRKISPPVKYQIEHGSYSSKIECVPNSGYSFNHFNVSGVSVQSNPMSVYMDADKTVIAYVEKDPVFHWDGTSEGGSVSLIRADGSRELLSAGFSRSFKRNTILRFEVSPNSGEFAFSGMAINGVSIVPSGGIAEYTLQADSSGTAHFVRVANSVEILLSGKGNGPYIEWFWKNGSSEADKTYLEAINGVARKTSLFKLDKTYYFRWVIPSEYSKLYVFENWYNGNTVIPSEGNAISVNGSQMFSVWGVFALRPTYSVTTETDPSFGDGTISLEGSSETPNPDGKYISGTVLKFKASPYGLNNIGLINVFVGNSQAPSKTILPKDVSSDGTFEITLEGDLLGDLRVVGLFETVPAAQVYSQEDSKEGSVRFYDGEVLGVSGNWYKAGTQIRVEASENDGFEIDSISISDQNGKVVFIPNGGLYEIGETQTKATISVLFKEAFYYLDYMESEGVENIAFFYQNPGEAEIELTEALRGKKLLKGGGKVRISYRKTSPDTAPYFIPNSTSFDFLDFKTGNNLYPTNVSETGEVFFENLFKSIRFLERAFATVSVVPSAEGLGSVSCDRNGEAVPVGDVIKLSARSDDSSYEDSRFDRWDLPNGESIQTSPMTEVPVGFFPSLVGDLYKIVGVFSRNAQDVIANVYVKSSSGREDFFAKASGKRVSTSSDGGIWDDWEASNIQNIPPQKGVKNLYITGKESCEVLLSADIDTESLQFKGWKCMRKEGKVWGKEESLSDKLECRFFLTNFIRVWADVTYYKYYLVSCRFVEGSENGGVIEINKLDSMGGTGTSLSVREGYPVVYSVRPSKGSVFLGWFDNKEGKGDPISILFSFKFIPDHDILLYAKFKSDSILYSFSRGLKNRAMTWRSKRHEVLKPFCPSSARVDGVEYPVKLEVCTFSDPDKKIPDGDIVLNMEDQNGRRMPYVRIDRYWEVGLRSKEEIDAVFVGTSFGGLRT